MPPFNNYVRAPTNVLLFIKVNMPMLIKWPDKFPQICGILKLE